MTDRICDTSHNNTVALNTRHNNTVAFITLATPEVDFNRVVSVWPKWLWSSLGGCCMSGGDRHWLTAYTPPMPYWNGVPPSPRPNPPPPWKGRREANWSAAAKRLLLAAEETIFSILPAAHPWRHLPHGNPPPPTAPASHSANPHLILTSSSRFPSSCSSLPSWPPPFSLQSSR